MEYKINPQPDIAEVLEMGQPHVLRKRLKRYLAIALVMIVAVAAVIILRTTGKSAMTQFKTEQVQRGDLTVIVTATGTLQPTNTVSVGSELSGIIKTSKSTTTTE